MTDELDQYLMNVPLLCDRELTTLSDKVQGEVSRRNDVRKKLQEKKLKAAKAKTVALAKKRKRKYGRQGFNDLELSVVLPVTVSFWFDESLDGPLRAEVTLIRLKDGDALAKLAESDPHVLQRLQELNAILEEDEKVIAKLYPEDPDRLREAYMWDVYDC